MTKINPLLLKGPIVMLADDRRGLLGFLIKSHKHGGNYNHICEINDMGRIASQDFVGFRERSISNYIKPHYFLKFWEVKDMPVEQKESWLAIIQADLDAPWKTRRYDWLGIIGQFLHIRWLQNPHTKYCSERVASHLRIALGMEIPFQPTPSELNELFKKNDKMKVTGYWFDA